MTSKSTSGKGKGNPSAPGTPAKETDKATKMPFKSRIVDVTEQDQGESFILVGGTPSPATKTEEEVDEDR